MVSRHYFYLVCHLGRAKPDLIIHVLSCNSREVKLVSVLGFEFMRVEIYRATWLLLRMFLFIT